MLAFASLLLACEEPPSDAQHLLLVSIGTLRADAPASLDAGAFSALDREGLRFDAHITVIPSTAASVASLWTGRYPRSHGLARDGLVLDAENQTLAEQLAAHGFATAAFTGDPLLASRFGFDQGFARYDASEAGAPRARGRRFARATTDAALAWWHDAGAQRRAVFVHYADLWGGPHPSDPPDTPLPIDVVRARRADVPEALALEEKLSVAYRARLAFVDAELKRLLEGVEASGQRDDTLVIVAGDHGLGGAADPLEPWGHGRSVSDFTVRTPLWLRWPGGLEGGLRIPALVANIDLAPTALAMLGIPALAGIDGVSLDGALRGDEVWPRDRVFLEAARPADPLREKNTRWRNERKVRGVRERGWKLVRDPMRNRMWLYDLRIDPEERQDASHLGSELNRLMRMQAQLEEWAARAPRLLQSE